MRALLLLGLMGCGTSQTTTDLAWLEGCWDSTTPQHTVSECWERSGDALQGEGRLDDVPYETTAIHTVNGTLQYVVRKADGSTTTFTASAATPDTVRFENPTHDNPKWIVYRREGDDLLASIGIGEEPSSEWRFVRR